MNKKRKFLIPKIELPELTNVEPERTRSSILENEEISHLEYIRTFVAGRLCLPGEQEEHQLSIEELEDVEPLGSGRYGFVRRMRHRKTDKHIAVKRIRITSVGAPDESNQPMKRLRQEVEAIQAGSDCDFIVKYFGLTFHEGDAWLCMELMDISLEHLYKTIERLHHNHFDEDTLGCVAISTVKALNFIKDTCHIIHRDIKPSNILLNVEGSVKLCDFGISGFLQNSVAQTRDAGCRPYMAPEKLSVLSHDYGIKSDVWSLGISMVEVANFEYPYPGFDDAPVFAQLQMVVVGDPPVVKNTKYNSRMRSFISQCLIKDVETRSTFLDLMNTNLYKHYNMMEDLPQKVAAYVKAALPHRAEFKRTENILA